MKTKRSCKPARAGGGATALAKEPTAASRALNLLLALVLAIGLAPTFALPAQQAYAEIPTQNSVSVTNVDTTSQPGKALVTFRVELAQPTMFAQLVPLYGGSRLSSVVSCTADYSSCSTSDGRFWFALNEDNEPAQAAGTYEAVIAFDSVAGAEVTYDASRSYWADEDWDEWEFDTMTGWTAGGGGDPQPVDPKDAGNGKQGGVDYAWSYGGNVTYAEGTGFTVAPYTAEGVTYVIDTVVVDGAAVELTDAQKAQPYVVESATSSVFATFAYTVNFNSPDGGTLTVARADGSAVLSGTVVRGGEILTITAAPAEGFELDGALQLTGFTAVDAEAGTYRVTAVNGYPTPAVGVSFKQAQQVSFSVTVTPGQHMSASDAGLLEQSVSEGAAMHSVTMTPDEGYALSAPTITGEGVTAAANADGSYTVSGAPSADVTVVFADAVKQAMGDGDIDVGALSGTLVITETGYSVGGGAEVSYAGDYTLTGTAEQLSGCAVEVASGQHAITLDGLVLKQSSGNDSTFCISEGASVELTLVGASSIRQEGDRARGAALCVEPGASLAIAESSTGSLEAYVKSGGGAAIGGADGKGCGNITIAGGTVSASMPGWIQYGSAPASAVIGSGQDASSGGTVTISGGTVTVTQGLGGAGIGTGNGAAAGVDVTIAGGSVAVAGRAHSGSSGAGSSAAAIGGGCDAACGDIVISGGTVSVSGGYSNAGTNSEKLPAAIGSGCNTVYGSDPAAGATDPGSVTIAGGSVDVSVEGDVDSVAIGSGSRAVNPTPVVITGGTVRTSARTGFDPAPTDGENSVFLCVVPVEGALSSVAIDGADWHVPAVYAGDQAELCLYLSGADHQVAVNGGQSVAYLFNGQGDGTVASSVSGGFFRPEGTLPVRTGGCEGGTVSADVAFAATGDTVRLTATASADHVITGITVTPDEGEVFTLTPSADGTCSFTMPSCGVTVSGEFTLGWFDGYPTLTNVVVTLDDEGTLRFEGSGNTRPHGYYVAGKTNAPWLENYKDAVKAVEWGEGVAPIDIGFYFYECGNLESATVPASVTSMEQAFYGCKAFTELPSGFSIPTKAMSSYQPFYVGYPYSSNNLLATYCDASDFAMLSAFDWAACNRELKVREGTGPVVTDASVTVTVEPAGAALVVTGPDGDAVEPDEGGAYVLEAGKTYTATASAEGYFERSVSFLASDGLEVSIVLDSTEGYDGLLHGGETGDRAVSESGRYRLADDATGRVEIEEGLNVEIVGASYDEATGSFSGPVYHDLTIAVGDGSTLTLHDVRVEMASSDGSGTANVVEFQGTGRLDVEGVNLLDRPDLYDSCAMIHVGPGASVVLGGSGTLYGYKHAAGAFIGANANESNGDITFEGGTWFIKGSKTGAIIGTDTVPGGTITINGGQVYLRTVSQGAAIGCSKEGTAGAVVVNGGMVMAVADFSGSAIGDGGGRKGAGTLTVNGGSLMTVATPNAYGSWGIDASESWGSVATSACVTAATDAAMLRFPTDAYADEASISVSVDGFAFYEGSPRYAWVADEQKNPAGDPSTVANWLPNDAAFATAEGDYAGGYPAKPGNRLAGESALYLWLPAGADHVIEVGGDAYDATWDEGAGTWSLAKREEPVKADIADAEVTGVADKSYNGKPQYQANLKVTYKGVELVKGTDYSVKTTNNVDAGEATVTITGKGAYEGTKAVTFKVRRASVAFAAVDGLADKSYTGKAQYQAGLKVTYNGMELVKGTDYSVKTTDNVDAGTATVTITGKGNYGGTQEVTFKIRRASVAFAKVTGVKSPVTYAGGKVWQSGLAVTQNGGTLEKGTDYSVLTANNDKVGTATVTITGKGNYGGSQTVEFEIVGSKLAAAKMG